MADNPAGMGTPPDALVERSKVLTLSDGKQITVRRWSLVRMGEVARYIVDSIRELAGLNGKAVPVGELVSSMKLDVFKLLEKLPERALGLLHLVVQEQDKATVGELEAEDAMDVINAAFELNFTTRLKKKAMRLATLAADVEAGS